MHNRSGHTTKSRPTWQASSWTRLCGHSFKHTTMLWSSTIMSGLAVERPFVPQLASIVSSASRVSAGRCCSSKLPVSPPTDTNSDAMPSSDSSRFADSAGYICTMHESLLSIHCRELRMQWRERNIHAPLRCDTCATYRSLAEYCTTCARIWWEKYLEIAERSWVFPHKG
jgi:hypothetical protein